MDLLPSAARSRLLAFLDERFGLVLPPAAFFSLGKGRIHLATREVAAAAAALPVVVAGLPCARLSTGSADAGSGLHRMLFKPATALLQRYGPAITKNCIDLAPEQAKEFMAGRDLVLATASATEGFVAVRFRGHVLGCGLLKPSSADRAPATGSQWSLKSQVPRAKRVF